MCLFLQERVGESFAKHAVGDQDTTFAVLRSGASVDPDTGSSGDLEKDGKQFAELGAASHLQFIDEGGNEAVRVLQCRCYGCQVLLVYTRTP